ncbi:putative RNA methyltransferase [Desertihabitans aurantiacus]|uniref:putative RNA methyltransferase n=1 Tax=Desertihabitans aurantiacus TaxID=2282477 RepID=UPI000DF733A5|nr:methyltransferase domain-containing protein [Desertihabitans aurantiacus]
MQPLLRCPVGGHREPPGLELVDGGRRLRCADGHSFDVARQGHVNLMGGVAAGANADTATMVAARERVHEAGLLDLVGEALVEACADLGEAARLVETGGGTGQHLARVVAAGTQRVGLSTDVSTAAARRAARVHPRVASVVADSWRPWPLLDGRVDAVLVVFAPRNAAEAHRVLRPGGTLVVVTPEPDHLDGLRGRAGLMSVQAGKAERLEEQLGGRFEPVSRHAERRGLELSDEAAADLALMGPNGHHTDRESLLRRRPGGRVTLSVRVARYRRSGA